MNAVNLGAVSFEVEHMLLLIYWGAVNFVAKQ